MEPYDIEEAFAAIEEELIASMMRNMKRHKVEESAEEMRWEMWQAKQLQALEKYKKQNQKKFQGKFADINGSVDEIIHKARKQGGLDQEIEIMNAIKKGWKPPGSLNKSMQTTGEFFKLNDRKLNALIGATRKDFSKAEHAMLRMADDQYRKIIFNAQVYANTGAGTYEKAVDMATKDFLGSGINCIEYKNGARHKISDYAFMAIQTASKRAYLTGEGEKRQEWGISTVIVNKRGNPCPKCLPFVGKILVDDVWSGGKPSDGKYPLMSTAIAAGLYHPRCKDSHTTYFEGISSPPDDKFTKKEMTSIEIQAKQESRWQYAERQSEKFQRLASYSLDENKIKAYRERELFWKEQSTKGRIKGTEMNRSALESPEYKRRIETLREPKEVTKAIWEEMSRAIRHRNGSKFEDLIFVDSKTGKVKRSVDYERISTANPTKEMMKMLKSSQDRSIVAIHNHPNSSVPSISDIMVAKERGYKYGLIACHNGNIFKYTTEENINCIIADAALERINNMLYNKNTIMDFDKEMKKAFGNLKDAGVELEMI